MADIKTGSCYFRDEAGQLFRADSYQREDGEVYTVNVPVDEDPAT